MYAQRLSELAERVTHQFGLIGDRRGEAYEWDAELSGGTSVHYVVRNVRSLKDWECGIKTLIGLLWDVKDHIKVLAVEKGREEKVVSRLVEKETVDRVSAVAICGDLANGLKHSKLKWSRSGLWPKLGKATFEVPQEAIGQIIMREAEAELHVAKPELVDFRLSVHDWGGHEIGEAGAIAEKTWCCWKNLINNLGISADG